MRRRVRPGLQSSEVDEPHAVDESTEPGSTDSQGQSSLSTAALTEQGHQPMIVEQRRHLSGLGVTSDERRQRRRQVVCHRPIGPQLGECGLKIGMVQLIERHRADASQIVRAQQTRSGRPGESAGLLDDVATEDDLTAVCGTHDPRRFVDRHADEPSSTLSHLTDMQTHANTDATVRRPGLSLYPPLRIECTLDRRRRRWKRQEHSVAFAALFLAESNGDGRPDDGVVALEDRAVTLTESVDEPGRSFDVRERQGTHRQLGHGRMVAMHEFVDDEAQMGPSSKTRTAMCQRRRTRLGRWRNTCRDFEKLAPTPTIPIQPRRCCARCADRRLRGAEQRELQITASSRLGDVVFENGLRVNPVVGHS